MPKKQNYSFNGATYHPHIMEEPSSPTVLYGLAFACVLEKVLNLDKIRWSPDEGKTQLLVKDGRYYGSINKHASMYKF